MSANSSVIPVDHRRKLGQLGEEAALVYLRSLGMTLIVRNWRCRIGELDLVMWDGREIVFVEVKSRYYSSENAKYLFDTVGPRKQRTLRNLVEVFLRTLRCRELPRHRLDLVGVLIDAQTLEPTKIEHLRAEL